MIRTLVTPSQQTISLTVPQQYIGKQIEVLMYAVDEPLKEEKASGRGDSSKYKGILSKEEGDKFNEHIQQARDEWNRDF